MPPPDHPLQPLYRDGGGRIRFKANAIVEFLLDHCSQLPPEHRVNMNELAVMGFTEADREQFLQLIGYDINGFADMSYVRDKTFKRAMAAADVLESGADATT